MKNLPGYWVGGKLIEEKEAEIPQSRMPFIFDVAKKLK
jgi:hypothetical protein